MLIQIASNSICFHSHLRKKISIIYHICIYILVNNICIDECIMPLAKALKDAQRARVGNYMQIYTNFFLTFFFVVVAEHIFSWTPATSYRAALPRQTQLDSAGSKTKPIEAIASGPHQNKESIWKT